MNQLDPHKKYVTRLLDRKHCIVRDDVYYIKDLRIFKNRSLANMVIVDNMPFSFIGQLNNGIYIPSYFGDDNDHELLPILQFLLTLKDVSDLRPLVTQFAGIVPLYALYTNGGLEADRPGDTEAKQPSSLELADSDQDNVGNEAEVD